MTAGAARLAAGERVLIVDARDRRYLLTLQEGSTFHTHAGILAHDDVIGANEGAYAWTATGKRFLALRPTLADRIFKMPRGAQVIYPKDIAQILMVADIAPGMRVLEAGVGSGALSMALLRAGALVVGCELRREFAVIAHANVASLLGEAAAYEVHERDVYEGIPDGEFDRVILDLPEPWRVLPHLAGALRPGGIFVAYLPTINQTAELRHALREGPFAGAETFEVLIRTWHVEGRSVRPDHRMVAHTGFVTHARMRDALQGREAPSASVSPAR